MLKREISDQTCPRTRFGRLAGRLTVALLGATLAGGPSTFAQTMSGVSRGAPDYGISRPLFPVRQPRSLTDPRRAARLDYYQQQGTRVRRNPFQVAAPYGPLGGLEARMSRFQSGRFIYPHSEFGTPLGPVSPERYDAFRTYGGFRRRPNAELEPGDVGQALQRRTALVQATSLYAPIQRANLANASVAGMRAALDLAPLPQLDLPAWPSDRNGPPSLVDELSRSVESVHARKIQEAWNKFHDGDFRGAVHDFESAADLQEDDAEPQIGRLFCLVSTGSARTAIAVLARIARRQRNPFLVDLNLSERYGRRVDVDVLRARARFQASAAQDNPAIVALSTFIFWYLGDAEEARSTVAALKKGGGGTVFADWPAMLDEAMSARPHNVAAPR